MECCSKLEAFLPEVGGRQFPECDPRPDHRDLVGHFAGVPLRSGSFVGAVFERFLKKVAYALEGIAHGGDGHTVVDEQESIVQPIEFVVAERAVLRDRFPQLREAMFVEGLLPATADGVDHLLRHGCAITFAHPRDLFRGRSPARPAPFQLFGID